MKQLHNTELASELVLEESGSFIGSEMARVVTEETPDLVLADLEKLRRGAVRLIRAEIEDREC